jgi:hypothetical protein
MPQNSFVCFGGLCLSVIVFNASVLLWSAFAGSQIGGCVVVCFFDYWEEPCLEEFFKDFEYNGEETYWSIGC